MIGHAIILKSMRWLLGGLLLAIFSSTLFAAQGTAPDQITVFTHGDSRFAQLNEDGSITGSAPDVMACAMPRLGIKYQFSVLPLSRATYVVNTLENAMWFPSSHMGNADRMQRTVGPIDDVTVLWYQLNTNSMDPNSDAFRDTARVTAYTGSALENDLRDGGYTILPGSADHNRLIYMLMSGEIDGLLAIDFRDVLKPETRRLVEKRLRVTLRRKIPISFQASVSLAKEHPDFITKFREAALECADRK